MNHLTDNELIDYTIRYSNDPEKVRLATHMERVAGAIIDDLVYAGMDETYCEFRSIVNDGMYHPGTYISHLEDEVKYLQNEVAQMHKELEQQKARTIADLIQELNQELHTQQFLVKDAHMEVMRANEERDRFRDKMKVWTALTTDVS